MARAAANNFVKAQTQQELGVTTLWVGPPTITTTSHPEVRIPKFRTFKEKNGLNPDWLPQKYPEPDLSP